MEFPAGRRKTNTYGKAGKKNLVPDLFDVATKPNAMVHTLRSLAKVPVAQSSSTSFNYTSEDCASARQLKQDLKIAASDEFIGEGPWTVSPCSTPAAASSPSLFEIESSDDDGVRTQTSNVAQKRRKLISQPSEKLKSRPANVPTQNASGRVPKAMTTAYPTTSNHGPTKATLGNSQKLEGRTLSEPEATSSAALPKSPRKALSKQAITRGVTQSDSETRHRTFPHNSSPRKIIQKKARSIGSPNSDKSTGSMASVLSTPKRKRKTAGEIPSNVSSPSQLELSSLQFTPEKSVPDKMWSLDLDNSDSSNASPQRNRKRLIDRLDVPKTQKPQDDVEMDDINTGSQKLTAILREPMSDSVVTRPFPADTLKAKEQSERTVTSQSATSFGKPRLTYRKQRSHLSDMVDSLEHSSGATQSSLQHIESQINSLAASASQFEVDDIDDNDLPSGSQLKSIHELRQAGAVNRFDRDLDALFEDIEADSKALRLQGLMQLVRRLQEQAFKRHLLDNGKLRRLTACASPDLDLPNAMVMLLSLWTLSKSEAASAAISSQIYQALLRLPASVISEDRPISTIARDRKENLSKALIRDLVSFETHVLQQSSKGDRPTSHIIISRVTLLCLDYTLRKVVELGEPVQEPPSEMIDAVLVVLKSHIAGLAVDRNQTEYIESVKLWVSWLGMTSACWKSDMSTPRVNQCIELGAILADLLKCARSGEASVEQSCLRLVVSLSNNDNIVSQHFVSPSLVDAIFAVVEDDFLQLAENAIQEKQFDEARLASVILALGCLLNFADSSADAREAMADVGVGSESQVDRLVNIFNRHVDETDEAVTIDQAQMAVGFGWLSTVLCTLCIDDAIRPVLSCKIKGPNLERLFTSVTEFMVYMEVSAGSGDTSNAFTTRFTPILETVMKKSTV